MSRLPDSNPASKLYRTIVADPPWPIRARMGYGGRRRRPTVVPYSFMTYDEVEALPVVKLAAESATLFLWSTRLVFREGIAARIARVWGFEPCGEIIWGLRNPGLAGNRALAPDHEPVLIARRGDGALKSDQPVGVTFWKQPYAHGKIHSAKPDGFLDLVESLSPGPYLELFARRQRLGWDTWGDQALEHIAL